MSSNSILCFALSVIAFVMVYVPQEVRGDVTWVNSIHVLTSVGDAEKTRISNLLEQANWGNKCEAAKALARKKVSVGPDTFHNMRIDKFNVTFSNKNKEVVVALYCYNHPTVIVVVEASDNTTVSEVLAEGGP